MKNFFIKLYRFSNSWTGTIVIVLFIIFFIAQAFVVPTGSMKNSILIGDHLFAKKFVYGVPTPFIPFVEWSLTPWTKKLHLIDGGKPKRGDIVIFHYPYDIKMYYVKRCVAIPGDELFVQDKNLYLHPYEGDAWIQKHYKGYTVIKKEGKLWVENPYTKTHPGIHHDPTIDQDTPVLLTNDGRMEIINTQSKYNMILNNQYRLPKNVRLLKHNPIFQTPIIKVPKNDYFMMGDNRDHSDDSRFWGFVPYDNLVGTPWFIYFSMNKDYQIRWHRMFKTPQELEKEKYIKRAVAEEQREQK
jgi:signal peptidase I